MVLNIYNKADANDCRSLRQGRKSSASVQRTRTVEILCALPIPLRNLLARPASAILHVTDVQQRLPTFAQQNCTIVLVLLKRLISA
jgi:hypothetical protein